MMVIGMKPIFALRQAIRMSYYDDILGEAAVPIPTRFGLSTVAKAATYATSETQQFCDNARNAATQQRDMR
ncbi:MAG TPA: hypothetical protein VF637_13305 [Sphingomicrobium sp.]